MLQFAIKSTNPQYDLQQELFLQSCRCGRLTALSAAIITCVTAETDNICS